MTLAPKTWHWVSKGGRGGEAVRVGTPGWPGLALAEQGRFVPVGWRLGWGGGGVVLG